MFNAPSVTVQSSGCPLGLSEQVQVSAIMASSKDLSRLVFDDLFEKDLLGFLLSTIHFHNHLVRMKQNLDAFIVGRLAHIVSDSVRFHEFHKSTLEMYAGVHIAECNHTTHADLMRDLDMKFKCSMNEDDALNCLVSGDGANEVELAWLYRSAANGGRAICQMG